MPKRFLSTDEQIKKFERIMHIANEAAVSDDVVRKIGAVTLYAGIVEFLTIQLARLIEQVMLKSQLAAGEPPKFTSSTDSYFYDKKIDTRKIINEIKKNILPFKTVSTGSAMDAEQANILAETLIKKTNKFLDYRNAIIHHVGSPSITFQQWNTVCDKAINAYEDFLPAHKALFEVLQSYRFGEKELHYFYGANER